MKIRNGFVSNSSSSSFLIYGCQVSKEVADKAEGMKDVKFDVVYGEYDSYYLGLSWHKVKDDQTGKEFKESVEVVIPLPVQVILSAHLFVSIFSSCCNIFP